MSSCDEFIKFSEVTSGYQYIRKSEIAIDTTQANPYHFFAPSPTLQSALLMAGIKLTNQTFANKNHQSTI